jgi:hypothetical protein
MLIPTILPPCSDNAEHELQRRHIDVGTAI